MPALIFGSFSGVTAALIAGMVGLSWLETFGIYVLAGILATVFAAFLLARRCEDNDTPQRPTRSGRNMGTTSSMMQHAG